MKKEDLVLIISPFVLTFIFLTFGYLILIRQTPEAKIGLFGGNQDEIVFLQESEMMSVAPKSSFPEEFEGLIATLPQNYVLLDQIIERANSRGAEVVLLNVPVTLESDEVIYLTGAQYSSKQNVLRWLRQTISILHEEGLSVILNVNLNASQTISDPAVFSTVYVDLLSEIADVANQVSVPKIMTGVTVGHPLYSQLETEDVSRILATIDERVGEVFLGNMGFGLCCAEEFNVTARSFDSVMLIPTPEYSFALLGKQAQEYKNTGVVRRIYYYDRDRSLFLSQAP